MSDIHPPASAGAGADHAKAERCTHQLVSSFFLPSSAGLGGEEDAEYSNSSKSSWGRGKDRGTEGLLTKGKRSHDEKQEREGKKELATARQLKPGSATAPAKKMTTSHTLSECPAHASSTSNTSTSSTSTSSHGSPVPISRSPHRKKEKRGHDKDDHHHETLHQLQQQQEQDKEQRVGEEGEEIERNVKGGFQVMQGEERARKKRKRQRHVYPAYFSSAPFLTPALQDLLIGLFRDDTLISPATNHHYFWCFRSFWERFYRALPPSLPHFRPLSTPQALGMWLMTLPVQSTFLRVRQEGMEGGLSKMGQRAVAIVLAALGLKLTPGGFGKRRELIWMKDGGKKAKVKGGFGGGGKTGEMKTEEAREMQQEEGDGEEEEEKEDNFHPYHHQRHQHRINCQHQVSERPLQQVQQQCYPQLEHQHQLSYLQQPLFYHHHEQQQQQQQQQHQQQQQQYYYAQLQHQHQLSYLQHQPHQQHQRQQWRSTKMSEGEKQHAELLRLFHDLPYLSHPLQNWLINSFIHNQAPKVTYIYIPFLRRVLLDLRPCFASFPPASSPASLQAAFLLPETQRALLACHHEQEDMGTEMNDWASRHAGTALKHLLSILRLKPVDTAGGMELVVVEGERGRGPEPWEGWDDKGGQSQEQGEEVEMVEEGETDKMAPRPRKGPRPFVYPSRLPYAPSISPALQDWLIGRFRDNRVSCRDTNQQSFKAFKLFWEHFERALPPSLLRTSPFSTHQALSEWLLEPQVQATILQVREAKRKEGRGGGGTLMWRKGVNVVLAGLGLRLTELREKVGRRLVRAYPEEPAVVAQEEAITK
ncbi:Hypothetical protein NocV09_01800030 [Nannochloropsis oceanica]